MNLSIVRFRQNMADPINRVSYTGERIVLERRGKKVAALVSMQDLARLEELENRLLAQDALTEEKRSRGARERPIPFEDVESEIDERQRHRRRRG